jgi:tetratricopeptide (TPR) repeat protein
VEVAKQPGGNTVLPEPAPGAVEEKYNAALGDAVGLLGEGKLADALAALESARSFRDTDFVRGEIAKLRTRIDQQAAAERTVQDIQAVLDQGKPAEASSLAARALQEYGATDAADPLTRLKLQADALAAADKKDDGDRGKRFRDEGQAALGEKNLRAAALAFEQALQYGEDADLRKQLDDLHATLTKYDDNRLQAAELRKDPARLEEAVALLKEAAKAWDTLQVRQEIDDYTLALQKRRDRVAVADFEVRGEVGMAAAGRAIAEEVLPALRGRFDVVERGQLDKVLDELKLEGGSLAGSPADQREVARVVNVRYVVVGSVTRLGGLVVNARLVEAGTGLVVQTAKVVAPTPDELLPLLPELARPLTMTDEERIRYEQDQARVAQALAPPAADDPVPPPPDAPAADGAMPAPVVVSTARPPDLGGVRAADFDDLAPPPADGPPVVVVEEGTHPVRRRLLQACLHLGDNLFRRGAFREAHRHFELALHLAPGELDVRLRVERCRPLVPPPSPLPVVVVVAAPPPPPRLAVLDFVEIGDPAVVPPGLGAWTGQQIAAYFYPAYEVVDRGEVFWWMGRLGLTYRDVLTDPCARRWLGRALNVRFFVVGTLRETASFVATTHLLDAETGFLYGAGRVHVTDPWELKLRLGELAQRTTLLPAARPRFEEDADRANELVVQARLRTRRGELSVAIGLFQDALKIRPGDVQVLAELQRGQWQAQQRDWEEGRKRELDRQQAEAEAWQRRQLELAAAAEAARVRAAEELAELADTERRARIEQWQRQQALAQDRLLAQARQALKTRSFGLSLQIFESATSLRPNDDVFRELALARAEADRADQERAAAERAAREAAWQRQRTEELAAARQRLEEQRRQRQADDQARQQAQDQRDGAAYQALFDQGQRLLNKEQYDDAISALQAARRVRKTDAVEALLTSAMVDQARAAARAKGEQARRDLERQLADEKARSAAAETLAKANQQKYDQALRQARDALAGKRYDEAATHFQEAGRLFRTDAVLTGMRQVEQGRTQLQTQARQIEQKKTAEAQRASNVQRLSAQGRLALEAKQYTKAVEAFAAARNVAPNDVDVLTGLAKAEQAQAKSAAEARAKATDQQRQQDFRRLLDGAKANLDVKQHDAAALAATEALKLKPGDAAALQAKAQAEAARKAASPATAPAPADQARRAEAYQKAMSAGRLAIAARQYDTAIKSFADAQKLVPGDKSAAAFLEQAQQAQQDAAAADAARARQRAVELERKAQDAARTAAADAQRKRQEQYQALLQSGRVALAAKRYDDAAKAFSEAGRLLPGDAAAAALLRQVNQARADGRRSQDQEAAQKLEAQRRQQDFTRLVTAGQTAVAQKRYDVAVKAYTDALKIMPGDAGATRALQDATAAQRAAGTPPPVKTISPPPPPVVPASQPPVEYLRQMQAGAALEKQKKLAEAMTAYQAALKALPGDARATAALRGAEVALHLDQGQKHLQAGRNADAAREFEAALRLAPGNREAQEGLSRAKKKGS